VTSRAATPARRGKLTREAARREAVDVLTVASAVAAYSARSIGNGLSPAEASRAALATAAELEHIAATLRRLARLDLLDRAERRRLVAELAATGMSQRAIAAAVGVDKRTVWGDLHGLATNVPHPGRVSINPSAASGSSPLRTVRVATPNSCASVVVDGIREPGG
jgi:transposase